MGNFIRGFTLGSMLVLLGFGLWFRDVNIISYAGLVLGSWASIEFFVWVMP
jgi:hypothetical protein